MICPSRPVRAANFPIVSLLFSVTNSFFPIHLRRWSRVAALCLALAGVLCGMGGSAFAQGPIAHFGWAQQRLGGSFSIADPWGMAVDGSGNVYIAEINNGVYEILAAGGYTQVTQLGGSNSFSNPTSVAVDGHGNVYVTDSGNYEVEEMTPNCYSGSCVTRLAGSFAFNNPWGVAVDSSGNVYVSDQGSPYLGLPSGVYEILAVNGIIPSNPTVTQLGGSFSFTGAGGGPFGIAVDGSGNVYVADYGNEAVEEMTPGCTSSSCVTPLGVGYGFSNPAGVAVDGSGNVYVADSQNNAVEEMTPDCTGPSCVTQLGGNSDFNNAFGVAVDGHGNVYVADEGSAVASAVVEMTSGCTSSTCVTQLSGSYRFNRPYSVAVDGIGNVYVADTGNNAVEEMTPDCTGPSCVTQTGRRLQLQSAQWRGSGRQRQRLRRRYVQ